MRLCVGTSTVALSWSSTKWALGIDAARRRSPGEKKEEGEPDAAVAKEADGETLVSIWECANRSPLSIEKGLVPQMHDEEFRCSRPVRGAC